MATYLMEATAPTAEQQLAAYYAQERGEAEGLLAGMGTAPMPRADMDPELAAALGVKPGVALTVAEFTNILIGRAADGEAWPGEKRAIAYKAPVNEAGFSIGDARASISYVDLTLSAPKSVSVAWAFAPEAERMSIMAAHRTARDQTLAYVEREIARAGFGHGHREGQEAGRFAWITCDHYTARPTIALTRADPVTGVIDTELYTVPGARVAGDPQLHSHNIVPNLMLTESGRYVAINRDLLRDRVHEFGAVYQGLLAHELRKIGMDACLDERTLMAKMPAVPEAICRSFSKRSKDGESAARDLAKAEGADWDGMSAAEQVKFIRKGVAATRQPKAELADAFAWRAQARAMGYEPKSFLTYGPTAPERTWAERIQSAYQTALPLFGDNLLKSAVVSGGQARLAAARGLIEWGMEGIRDIDSITRKMVKEGVDQGGELTSILWRVDGRGRVRITTALHRDEELELIALAKAAAADMRLALPATAIRAAVGRSTLDFSGEHGAAQLQAIEALGTQGGLAVMIGAAGVGKTAAVGATLVSAWKASGYEVYGTSVAWRQATALHEAGIDRQNCRAMDPFLRAVETGYIKLGPKSVIVLDELGQMGTHQLLTLLRVRDTSGAKIIAMGDDKQCTAVDAGPVIDLLRRGLGQDTIPEIFTTIRQRTEEERHIVGLFREGKVAEGIALKRASGTAELVEGGYRQAVNRVADLYMERKAANIPGAVSVSAPTNADAREIGRAIRDRRRVAGEVGPDLRTVRASDGTGEAYALRLAEGDRVRLFKRTRAMFDEGGKKGSRFIGDNGSVLEVAGVAPDGLSLRTSNGKVGFVAWAELRQRGSDLVGLTYGDCGTIDSSQGITSDEHIHAFPSGSQQVTGFKNYVAQTRHRVQSYMIGSMGAELKGAMSARPLGLPEPKGPDAHDAAWAHVAKSFAKLPPKESALAMLEALHESKMAAAAALRSGLRTLEANGGARLGSRLATRLGVRRKETVVSMIVDRLEGAAEERAPVIAAIERVAQRKPAMRVKVSATEAGAQLASFASMHGLKITGQPIMDGERHYVAVEGNKGREQSGAYMAFYEGVRPAGVVWNYKTGAKVNWKADGEAVPISTADQRALEATQEAQRAERVREKAQREDAGAARAQAIVDASLPARADHPYLVAKGVQAYGLRQTRGGNLVMPLHTIDGRLMNVQTITPEGVKRPVWGARKLDTFHVIGGVIEPGRPIFITEGYATGASVHEATGAPVVVAVDTSNLAPVARVMRAAHPAAEIVIAADNDAHLPLRTVPLPNAGVKKAIEAAAEIGARVLVPDELQERTAGNQGTDWNDYALARGLDATRDALRRLWAEAVIKVDAVKERVGARMRV